MDQDRLVWPPPPRPAEVRRDAQLLRDKARALAKESQRLRDAASLLRQATADVLEELAAVRSGSQSRL
jgi:hypothetical protein